MALGYFLKAKNSSQDMRLYIDKQSGGEVTLTMTGRHEGNAIQIDFDSLTVLEASELAEFLSARANGNTTV